MPLKVYRLRRVLAATAVLLTLVVTGMYFYARHRATDVLKSIPGKIGYDIKQTASGFQFSKSDGKRTIFTIQASELGKLKTVVQIVCVVSAVLAHRWFQWQFGMLVIPVEWIAIAAIYFTVLVSTISAIDYFAAFWKQIDHASKDRRKSYVLTRQKGTGTQGANP